MKWVAITGGGSGIGRILVHHFSKDYQVLTCGRNLSTLEETKAGSVNPRHVTLVEADISQSEDRQRFVDALPKEAELYLLVQNAAIGDPTKGIDDVDPTHLEYALQVNVVAPMALVQLFRPALIAGEGGGRVLHLGTSVAHKPQRGTLTYGVTKMAFHRLYQQLNLEGVVCGSLSPGLVDTEGVRDHVAKARGCDLPHVSYFDQAFDKDWTTPPHELVEFILKLLEMDDEKFASKEWRFSEWRQRVERETKHVSPNQYESSSTSTSPGLLPTKVPSQLSSSNMQTTTTDQGPIPDVMIVGAGVAGTSAAYHLLQAGVTNICILEAATAAGKGLFPRQSGSATMPDDGRVVKMMVQIFASTCAEFIHHHGMDGARRYLSATRQGLEYQKTIAKQIWQTDTNQNMKQLGSYCVAYEADKDALKKEFETLLKLGCEQDGIKWCDKDRLATVDGLSDKFYCGIYFPKECVIDSSLYARTLLQYVLDKGEGQAKFMPNTPVQEIKQTEEGATVLLKSGQELLAKNVVVATGALHQHVPLNGLVKPCYSYLVHVPTSEAAKECQHSPNFWTFGFTHDWCYTKGRIRISGEDHFSAYKPPLLTERCRNLSQWTLEQYNCPVDAGEMSHYPQQYGLYSETPDLAPLIGPLSSTPRICYLLGCNAWGQTILSYCSSLVPGLLGYKPLTLEQDDVLKLVSVQRFSDLPDN